MNHTLNVACIVAVFALHASGQDAYIDGENWYGHEVDSCYVDFDEIRDRGDREGTFSYARRHLRTMTHFTHGEGVFVIKTREVPPDDIVLVLVRRLGESTTYWTDPAALSTTDPLAGEKARAQAVRAQAERERVMRAREQFELEQKKIEQARAALKMARPPRRPIATERYWQVGSDRFRGKLVNANEKHVKIRKSIGETIIVDRRHLSETSDRYVGSMLKDLESYRQFQQMIATSL